MKYLKRLLTHPLIPVFIGAQMMLFIIVYVIVDRYAMPEAAVEAAIGTAVAMFWLYVIPIIDAIRE